MLSSDVVRSIHWVSRNDHYSSKSEGLVIKKKLCVRQAANVLPGLLQLYHPHQNLCVSSRVMVNPSISHDRQEETPEAKVRWFRSLSLSERMELLCFFTELILAANPRIVEQRDAQSVAGRVRVLSAT